MRTLQDDINSGEAMVLEDEDFDEENLPDI